jgi:hypothetical protein
LGWRLAAVSASGVAFFKGQSCYLYKFPSSHNLLDEKPSKFIEEMVSGSRWINLLNQYLLFWYIKAFVKSQGRLILWINDPYKYLMIKLLKPEIAVYDCPDAIVFKNSSRKQRLYDQFKKRVLQESTVSLFTSKALLDDGARYAENHYYVPNGVDVQGFIQERYKTPEIARGPHPNRHR